MGSVTYNLFLGKELFLDFEEILSKLPHSFCKQKLEKRNVLE